MSKVKNNGVSELNKAIFTLLYDQSDCPDMRITDSDEAFVEHIAYALSKKMASLALLKAMIANTFAMNIQQIVMVMN